MLATLVVGGTNTEDVAGYHVLPSELHANLVVDDAPIPPTTHNDPFQATADINVRAAGFPDGYHVIPSELHPNVFVP
jgi:hypothetical protein